MACSTERWRRLMGTAKRFTPPSQEDGGKLTGSLVRLQRQRQRKRRPVKRKSPRREKWQRRGQRFLLPKSNRRLRRRRSRPRLPTKLMQLEIWQRLLRQFAFLTAPKTPRRRLRPLPRHLPHHPT